MISIKLMSNNYLPKLSASFLAATIVCTGCSQSTEVEEAAVQTDNIPTYRVVSNASYPPFENLDAQGNVVGFDVDLLTAIGEEEGFKVEFQSQPWVTLFTDLQSHKADIIASSVWITDERKQKYGVSDAYYSSPMALLTRRVDDNVQDSYTDIKDKTVAVAIGGENDAFYSEFLQQNNNTKLQSDSSFLAFKNLMTNKANYVSDATVRLNYNVQSYSDAEDTAQSFAIITDPAFPVWEWGFIVNKDNPELLNKINSGLQKVRQNGTYDKIQQKWLEEAL